ncbi:ribosomal protein S18-alanine N-acetyltransferase [Plantibacter sp. T3]|uniref:ribosomal protein S18-alanine N-acetyltransferase n=1 Tax=Plantibacter sp. T3 TaxID=2653161 RepID=UPI0012EF1597|nr:ribosomal protein S18-alanine N-acetyltransferase [Plantibacter sp. T3]VXB83528.1 Ribosomal-protein-S18p-alanine acetyltransferase [Plantibacter sp. T3]
MSWSLRRAGVADLDAIMELEHTVFVNDAWSADMMRAELSSPHGYYLVATEVDADDATLAGYGGLFAPSRSDDADIQTIAVAAHARGRGLGRLLMQALIEQARQQDVAQVFLEVRADNPVAIALYRSLGFEELGVRPGYYQPDDVDAIVMRLTVQPRPPMPAHGQSPLDQTDQHPGSIA